PIQYRTPHSPLFPYTTLFRSRGKHLVPNPVRPLILRSFLVARSFQFSGERRLPACHRRQLAGGNISLVEEFCRCARQAGSLRSQDRKSTRLNSSHVAISYAVF